MKMRVTTGLTGFTGFIGVTVVALAFAAGCGDDSSTDSVDAGLEAGAVETETEPADTTKPTPTPSETDEDTTGPIPTTGGDETTEPTSTDECDDAPRIICDGNDRVSHDSCTDNDTVLETCETACELGKCVECASNGVTCSMGDVHVQDSCGDVGALLTACDNGCSKGKCIADDCEPLAAPVCQEGALVEVDSCDNVLNIVEICAAGCDNGACVGCTDDGDTLCYSGDVYPVDSCGVPGDVLEECAISCSVGSGDGGGAAECSDVVCTPTADTVCFNGDLYTKDSCGGVVDSVVTDCHNGCDEAGCSPCIASADGVMCFDGDVYDTVGGCGDPSIRAATAKEECDFGCFNGACAAEGECIPQGTVCIGNEVHTADSCEQVTPVVETCLGGCMDGACLDVDGGATPVDGGMDASTEMDSSVSPEIDSGTTATETATGTDTIDAGPDAGDASP
jgi:hypothetical protein